MEFKQYLTPMNIGIGICIIILIALIILWFRRKKAEQYTSSSMAHIGGLSDYGRLFSKPPGYDVMQNYGSQYNPFFPPHEYEHFGASERDQHLTWNEKRTIDRLDRIDAELLPKVSTSVTPYNIDVADPVTYTYQVHAPRVIRKDRLAMEADPVRGDVPIMIYPDVPLIQRSQFNRDSLRLDGAFSEALAKSYDRLTGKAYFNQPSQLSHGGLMM